MTTPDEKTPAPDAPGYGDQGQAGGGRDPATSSDEAAETGDETEPVVDPGG